MPTLFAAISLLLLCVGPTYTRAAPEIWETDLGSELGSLAGADDAAEDVSLSFSFPFLGSGYTEITVGTDGVLGLGGNASFVCCPVESNLFDEAQPTIAPFWSDLTLAVTGKVLCPE